MGAQRPWRGLGTWPTAAMLLGALAIVCPLTVWAGLVPPLLGWDAAWTAGSASALAGMLAARGAADRLQRPRWTWWALAAGAWLAGQIAWDVFSFAGTPPTPSVADLGWWGFAALVIVGLLHGQRATDAGRLVTAIEGLPLIAAAMAVTFAELWSSAASSPLTTSGRLTALLYPVLYVSASMLTLQAMVGGSLLPVRGPGSRLVLLGIVIQAASFISWSEQLLRGAYEVGATAVDPMWLLGMLAIAGGGLLAGRHPEAPARARKNSHRGGLLPAAAFALLAVTLIHAGVTDAALGAQLMLVAGVLVAGAALIGRALLLERRLHVLLERERSAREELAGREAELARLNERLREDSRRDPLTGLRNRRALVDDLPEIELQARRAERPFAIAICDVDRFKAYNDRLGHLAGDQALRSIATMIRLQLRAGDEAYRYGGEELVLVLRDANVREALTAAERVRAAVADAALPHPDDPAGVITLSVGVAAGLADSSALLARADRALYDAKRGGRNRALAADEADVTLPARRRTDRPEDPVLRHLRSLLAVSRAATSGRGPLPVLEAAAETIRSELRFQTVAVNLREGPDDDLRVVIVLGTPEARAALLDATNPWKTWHPLLDPKYDRCGASWIPAGAYDFTGDLGVYTPDSVPRTLDPDAWDNDDMLLLPLRSSAGEVLGVISIDEPLSGRRPSDSDLELLMAVADHTALALERSLQASAPAPAGEVPELRLAAVMLLAETLDLRDTGTAEHSQTVGGHVRDTAAALGLAPQRVERLHAAGVLHDLGKLGIADAILHKQGPLEDAEWREIRRHPEIGARILEYAGLLDIAGWVRAHHERLDGRGYPDGLNADDIPLEARILAVADAYEAMVADRPYRAGMPAAEARAELLRCAGTQFDPDVVEAFLSTLGSVTAPARARAAA